MYLDHNLLSPGRGHVHFYTDGILRGPGWLTGDLTVSLRGMVIELGMCSLQDGVAGPGRPGSKKGQWRRRRKSNWGCTRMPPHCRNLQKEEVPNMISLFRNN